MKEHDESLSWRGVFDNVVVKIFGHERKPGKDEQIGVVQRVHMYVRIGDRKVGVGSGPTL